MKEFKIGEMATMEFHMMGLITYEELEINDLEEGIIYLGECYDDAWKFDIKTGKCLNDNNFLGAFRRLKLTE